MNKLIKNYETSEDIINKIIINMILNFTSYKKFSKNLTIFYTFFNCHIIS